MYVNLKDSEIGGSYSTVVTVASPVVAETVDLRGSSRIVDTCTAQLSSFGTLEIYPDYGITGATDGGFEIAGGGPPNTFQEWATDEVGASTVTQDADANTLDTLGNGRDGLGSYSCKFTLDGSASQVDVYHPLPITTIGRENVSTVSFYAKGTPGAILCAGNDAGDPIQAEFVMTASWTLYQFTHSAYPSAVLAFFSKDIIGNANAVFYIDDVTLEPAVPFLRSNPGGADVEVSMDGISWTNWVTIASTDGTVVPSATLFPVQMVRVRLTSALIVDLGDYTSISWLLT